MSGETSTNQIIQLQGLQFNWPGSRPFALQIPELAIQSSERIFLHGPSGSGKSTLLGLIGGVLIADKGTVNILNCNLSKLSNAGRDRFRVDHIGFIFQQFNLVPYLSVLENVVLPCKFSNKRAQASLRKNENIHAAAKRLLNALGLDQNYYNAAVTQLSIGQQQRVAAARALIGEPALIIADEPTSALDEDHQEDFIHVLLEQCDATASTLLFVSHNHRLSSRFSRQIALQDICRA
jgi:putative ABC transport system ATP-binding protein